MVRGNLFGQMGLPIKDNLQTTELVVKEFINGQMEVYIKVK
jgi:hypothetical protein